MQRAEFGYTAAAPEGHFHHPLRDRPLELHLPLSDDDGDEVLVSFGVLTLHGLRAWISGGRTWRDETTQRRVLRQSPEIYGEIGAHDWAVFDWNETHYALATGNLAAREASSEDERRLITDKNDRVRNLIDEYEQRAAALEANVDGCLGTILDGGLEARAGTHLLDEPDFSTYLQIRSRWLPKPTRWQVCERCDLVFSRRRRIEHDSYRCPDCHNKPIPRLRTVHPHRPCAVCGALFVPSDVRQTNCSSCKAASVGRSRNPGRPVAPGTGLRSVTIDVDLTIEPHDPTRPPAPYWEFLRSRNHATGELAETQNVLGQDGTQWKRCLQRAACGCRGTSQRGE